MQDIESKTRLFEKKPVLNALLTLAVPTVAGQVILVIYNMADTFYIGLCGSDAMLTAVTVCLPSFMFLSAIANLFGVGGASAGARSMGASAPEDAKACGVFSFFGSLLATVIYCLLVRLFMNPFIDLLGGTHAAVHAYARQYMLCTVVIGGIASSANIFFSHLLRAEGYSLLAGFGISFGGVLNIVLDPLFMFRILQPGNEVLGAAAATALSNIIAAFFYISAILRIHKKLQILDFRPTKRALVPDIYLPVFSAGIPACVMTLFENISYAVMDKLISVYGTEMQAGIGVAKKVNMMAHSIVRGITQGALPLIAYNYASGNHKRMRAAMKWAAILSVGCATLCMVICLLFDPQLIGIFIRHESASLGYGAEFLEILCIGAPFSAAAYTVISFFQATGHGKRSFFLAILRKGLVDIPLMFLLGSFFSYHGIVSATPIADILCCITALFILRDFLKTHAAEVA